MHTVTTATGTYLSDGLARLSITSVNESRDTQHVSDDCIS